MTIAGWIVALIALVALGVERYKRERRRAAADLTGRFLALPSMSLEELDPVFASGPFGPTVATEVHYIGHGPIAVPGGTSDAEAWILAVLAKTAPHCFEFGTCTGKTSYLWARNMPEGGRVVTITLAPEQRDTYAAAAGDTRADTAYALKESVFTDFLYSGTPAAGRIEQLFGDSKAFDESPYVNWADLVFVDGAHAESYVVSDSEKALRIVKPGGLILWHDFMLEQDMPGVYRGLTALGKRLPLRHVSGTTFVAYRKPLHA